MARILIVDDDEDIRELVARHVRNQGHKVLTAGSATEALAVIEDRGAPDLAVLDFSMPEVGGFDLLVALRAREGLADLPVIFLSAKVQDADIHAGRALGAAYLTKPFIGSALRGKIDGLLAASDTGGW
jgi:DNA-binding response OmpR family regulator